MTGTTHSATDDLIRGAVAIGKELGRSGRWVYQHKNELPLFYDGGQLCAFKSALEAHAQARVKRLDALRVEMIEEAAKAIPIIGKRRTRRDAAKAVPAIGKRRTRRASQEARA